MTLEQVNGALGAVEREERRSLRNTLIMHRAAQVKDEAFKAILRRLDSDTE